MTLTRLQRVWLVLGLVGAIAALVNVWLMASWVAGQGWQPPRVEAHWQRVLHTVVMQGVLLAVVSIVSGIALAVLIPTAPKSPLPGIWNVWHRQPVRRKVGAIIAGLVLIGAGWMVGTRYQYCGSSYDVPASACGRDLQGDENWKWRRDSWTGRVQYWAHTHWREP